MPAVVAVAGVASTRFGAKKSRTRRLQACWGLEVAGHEILASEHGLECLGEVLSFPHADVKGHIAQRQAFNIIQLFGVWIFTPSRSPCMVLINPEG